MTMDENHGIFPLLIMDPLILDKYEKLLLVDTDKGLDVHPSIVYVHRVVDYLHERYMDKIYRHDIARNLSLNADYLGKIFKEHTGLDMRGYLNRLRIIKAAEMLIASNDIIPVIARVVGFESVRSFHRIFIRIMGVTAGRFREQAQKN